MDQKRKGLNKWYPGHMKSARSLIKTYAGQVDLIVNLLDARAPMASGNFAVLNEVKNKPIVCFLGKSDLASESLTKQWAQHFNNELGFYTVPVNCKNFSSVKNGFNLACSYWRSVKKAKFGRDMIRIMVVGISNVGKSTLINSISKSKKAKVENRPGVTKSKQWVFLENGMSLLDTPGVLPVDEKSENEQFALQLIGAVKREEIEVEELAVWLLNFLNMTQPSFFERNFSNHLSKFDDAVGWLNNFAKLKGMLLKGSEPDLNRAANFLISSFQKGVFGRITIEVFNSYEKENG